MRASSYTLFLSANERLLFFVGTAFAGMPRRRNWGDAPRAGPGRVDSRGEPGLCGWFERGGLKLPLSTIFGGLRCVNLALSLCF